MEQRCKFTYEIKEKPSCQGEMRRNLESSDDTESKSLFLFNHYWWLSISHNIFLSINFFLIFLEIAGTSGKVKETVVVSGGVGVRWEGRVSGVFEVGWAGEVSCAVWRRRLHSDVSAWKKFLPHSTAPLNHRLLVLEPLHPDTPSLPAAGSATDGPTFVKS